MVFFAPKRKYFLKTFGKSSEDLTKTQLKNNILEVHNVVHACPYITSHDHVHPAIVVAFSDRMCKNVCTYKRWMLALGNSSLYHMRNALECSIAICIMETYSSRTANTRSVDRPPRSKPVWKCLKYHFLPTSKNRDQWAKLSESF